MNDRVTEHKASNNKANTRKLLELLGDAVRMMEHGFVVQDGQLEPGTAQRLAAQLYLQTLMELLEAKFSIFRRQQELLIPLARLGQELHDLQNSGRTGPLLTPPTKTPGGSRSGTDEIGLHVTACVAVTIATESKAFDRSKAAEKVAKILDEHGFTKGRQSQGNPDPITGETVLGWLKKCKSKSEKQKYYCDTYSLLVEGLPWDLKRFPEFSVKQAEQAIRIYLSHAVLLTFGHLRDFDYIKKDRRAQAED